MLHVLSVNAMSILYSILASFSSEIQWENSTRSGAAWNKNVERPVNSEQC